MRSSTLLWLALAVICGGVLFCTTQRVTDGRARLAILDDSIRKENETIRVLDAEWSYLNQPGRLEKLSKQYLNLGPMTGRQFSRISDLADRTQEAVAASLPSKDAQKKAEAEKPAAAPVKEASAPVVKILKPPSATHAPPVRRPLTADGNASRRDFGDVMKSLGVHDE